MRRIINYKEGGAHIPEVSERYLSRVANNFLSSKEDRWMADVAWDALRDVIFNAEVAEEDFTIDKDSIKIEVEYHLRREEPYRFRECFDDVVDLAMRMLPNAIKYYYGFWMERANFASQNTITIYK